MRTFIILAITLVGFSASAMDCQHAVAYITAVENESTARYELIAYQQKECVRTSGMSYNDTCAGMAKHAAQLNHDQAVSKIKAFIHKYPAMNHCSMD